MEDLNMETPDQEGMVKASLKRKLGSNSKDLRKKIDVRAKVLEQYKKRKGDQISEVA